MTSKTCFASTVRQVYDTTIQWNPDQRFAGSFDVETSESRRKIDGEEERHCWLARPF